MCVYIEGLTPVHSVYIVRGMAAKPTKRAKRTGPVALHINLPAELIAAYDARVEALNANPEGPRWTRTDLIKSSLASVAKGWEASQNLPHGTSKGEAS